MHHVIWVEHDGSWTWSIEDGYKVLARDEGFPTRADAKEDMRKAWAKLLSEGKKPGRPDQQKRRSSKKKFSNPQKFRPKTTRQQYFSCFPSGR